MLIKNCYIIISSHRSHRFKKKSKTQKQGDIIIIIIRSATFAAISDMICNFRLVCGDDDMNIYTSIELLCIEFTFYLIGTF